MAHVKKMKTAIIIGATSGLGQEIARRLVKDGWRVGITGRRVERLIEFQNRHGSDNVFVSRMDVTEPESVHVLDSLLEDIGQPDLFFYASGVGYQNRDLDEAKEITTVKTNCEGMVRMVSHFVNYVKNQDYTGRSEVQIAVITSVAGTEGLGTAPAYSATKKMQSTYLTALSQLARMEGIPVRFTDIRPGFVATEILKMEGQYPLLMTAQEAGAYIMNALRRRKRICTFDWKFRFIVFLWRLIPRFIWERLTFVRLK